MTSDGLETKNHVDLLYLACLVGSLWRLGGPWPDPGTLGAQEMTPGGPGLDFCLFFVDLGTPF